MRVTPVWLGTTNRFRYRIDRAGGRELVFVDAERNSREVRTCRPSSPDCEEPDLSIGADSDGVVSPDRRWVAFVREHDLYVRSLTDGRTIRLTNDGTQDHGYGEWADSHLLSVTAALAETPRPARVLWAPDSRKLLTYRIDQRNVPVMPFVQWVPKEGYGARPALHGARIPLPADEQVSTAALMIFHLPGGRRVDVRTEPLQLSYDFFSIGQAWWDPRGRQVFCVREERGFRKVTLLVARADTGETRELVKEVAVTSFKGRYDSWAKQGTTDSYVLWLSPRDGWQHLYRYSVDDGRLLGQVTRGNWAVNEVLYTDSRDDWIYFTAGGRESGRDPYLLHLYRTRPDGSQLRLLTPEDAHHEISFSPGGRYFIDRYSRVDTPPVTLLRAADGRLVRVLERADIGKLIARGWQKPERFRAEARDGKTPIYGVLYRPSDLDPRRKYPIVEDVYGGPQVVHAPRAFTAGEPMAELGFMVVQIDGLGTPGRSSAFQDASYGKGFAEAGGLADHIAAIRQLATRYAYLDLDRVGIYGYSGGGYAAARALFDHPDFYKVAVAGAGSHDQLLYQFEWGEHFIGRPSESAEAYELQANRTRAGNLRGKLLLVHGDLDDDVPLANTMQLVSALIAANRDFDLLVVPNRNHDSLYTDPYFIRRQWDYFVKNLLGVEPPGQYQIGGASR